MSPASGVALTMSRSCRRNVGRPFDFSDQLIFNPNVERRSYTVPDLKNRYTQVVAPVGNFSVSYTAEIYLNIYHADPETGH